MTGQSCRISYMLESVTAPASARVSRSWEMLLRKQNSVIDVVRNVWRYVSVGVIYQMHTGTTIRALNLDVWFWTWLQRINLSSVRAKLDRGQVLQL